MRGMLAYACVRWPTQRYSNNCRKHTKIHTLLGFRPDAKGRPRPVEPSIAERSVRTSKLSLGKFPAAYLHQFGDCFLGLLPIPADHVDLRTTPVELFRDASSDSGRGPCDDSDFADRIDRLFEVFAFEEFPKSGRVNSWTR